MSPFPVSARLSPEVRASLYHFSVFGATGAGSVYFGIWLKQHGVAASEIGIINALPLVVMLAINVLIGRIADRASDWRVVIIALSVWAGLAPLLLFHLQAQQSQTQCLLLVVLTVKMKTQLLLVQC